MVEQNHYHHSRDYCNQVPHNTTSEIATSCVVCSVNEIVNEGVSLASSLSLLLSQVGEGLDSEVLQEVKSETERHEDARNNDISQSQNRVLRGIHTQVSRELQFNGGIDVLGHSDHHVGAEHEEYVVEEEESEEDGSVLEVAQEDELEGVDAEHDGQDVIVDPALTHEVDGYLDEGEYDADQVQGTDA